MWERQHAARCEELLGKPFHEVHQWIDALAHVPERGRLATVDWPHVGPLNPHHRKHRHNRWGIEEVRKMWGDDAAEAAKLHILDDFFGPCPHTEAQEKQIPFDAQDYVRRGWM